MIEDEERKDHLYLDVNLRLLRVLQPFYNGLSSSWKEKFYISISRKESVSAIEDRLKKSIEIIRKPSDLVFSVWKLEDRDQEMHVIRKLESMSRTGIQDPIKIEAVELERNDVIDECRILPEDVLLVEVRKRDEDSVFENVMAAGRKETNLELP